MSDYFSVFDLPRKLRLDAAELRRRFYELSRRHHPDFHRLGTEDEQAASLTSSALVNRAYRALRDPIARVEYLVTLEEGRESREGGPARPRMPQDLLEEVLEVQEALEEARSAGLDEASRPRLAAERARLVERRAATEAAIIARGADWDAAVDAGGDRVPLVTWFKEALAARAYLTTVIEDLGQALGEEQDSHVTHRRH